ncbi:hypothetical protein OV090_07155 [Nannocystis sp. RBIL2]|uniref:hypothetical protein n=1 Tax=Nannocystis sp. RBIL2 TaxID=2996788 RepID=UPI00226E63C3|nr:hypothetical protein [Nannocystis sp. RBIL2]MCY1064532.1 hypothetical protein [Nannocystis sp. RBIL2]
MSGERRYDEREVGQILRRVAELHAREGEKTDARSMSRGEIEEVVQELGISKALVARATGELALQDVRNRPVWWAGGKIDLMFEDVVDGQVDDARLSQMIEVLRRSLGDPGQLKQEAGARIWSATTRRIHLTVVEHEGRTTLRLEERMDASVTLGSAFLGGFAGFLAGLFAVVLLKGVVIKALLLLLLGAFASTGAVAGWIGGRALWRRRSEGHEAQLRQAFAAIVALTDGLASRQSPPDE